MKRTINNITGSAFRDSKDKVEPCPNAGRWFSAQPQANERKNRIVMITKVLVMSLSCVLYFSPVRATMLHAKKNVIYLEAFGVGGYGSINYEKIFWEEKFIKAGVRGGLSTYHIKDYTNHFNPDIIIPLSLNTHIVFEHHALVLCFGETISSVVYASQTDYKPKRGTDFSPFFDVGYAYEWQNGCCLGIGYSPVIYKQDYRHWFKLSFGYAF